MDIKGYINKYFRFNRKSDKPFIYTFFPNIRCKIIDLKVNKVKDIINSLSDCYYEYIFNNDKVYECNELILDQDKCIISGDLSVGLFYDAHKNDKEEFY